MEKVKQEQRDTYVPAAQGSGKLPASIQAMHWNQQCGDDGGRDAGERTHEECNEQTARVGHYPLEIRTEEEQWDRQGNKKSVYRRIKRRIEGDHAKITEKQGYEHGDQR